MGFELGELARIARRWWWLLLLGTLLGGGGMYFFSKAQQPMYRATATLWIQIAPGTSGLDPGVIQAGMDLAVTYRHLVTMASNLSPVIDDLRLPDGLDELRGRLAVTVVRGTPLIEITASDEEPERAAAIADAIANRFSDSIDQFEIGSIAPNSAGSVAVPAENVSIQVLPAEVPREPYAPRTTLFTLLGACLGLLIVAGVVGLTEYLDKKSRFGADQTALMEPSLVLGIQQVLNPQRRRE